MVRTKHVLESEECGQIRKFNY